MVDLAELVEAALERPLIGIATASWVAVVAIGAYWLKRSDNNQTVKRGTKIVFFALSFVAAVFTAINVSSKYSGKEYLNISTQSGGATWGVSDVDWSCLTGVEIWKKYNLENRRGEIVEKSKTNADAAYLLGVSYYDGVGLVQEDKDKGRKLFQFAANAGSSRALNGMGVVSRDDRKIDDAVLWFKKAYDRGLGIGAYQLGLIYSNKRYGMQPNGRQAAIWFEAGDRMGCVSSTSYLGYIYRNGVVSEGDVSPVEKDEAKAIDLFIKSSKSGDADATRWLGDIEEERKNLKGAEYWYRKAASLGDKKSYTYLGYIYDDKEKYDEAIDFLKHSLGETGGDAEYQIAVICYKRNRPVEGMKWLKAAEALGNESAKEFISKYGNG